MFFWHFFKLMPMIFLSTTQWLPGEGVVRLLSGSQGGFPLSAGRSFIKNGFKYPCPEASLCFLWHFVFFRQSQGASFSGNGFHQAAFFGFGQSLAFHGNLLSVQFYVTLCVVWGNSA
jgi:hypothetical protein